MQDAPQLELRGIDKSFGAVQALTGVDFDVRVGEVVALVGDNGAGKSTLVKVMAGNIRPDGGEIRWGGQPVELSGPADAGRLGIVSVYQDLALCNNLDIVANLFLGREPAGRGGFLGLLDEEEMEQRALAVLHRLSVSVPSVRVPVGGLSGGQRQSIAVARTVLWDNRVVLLDEPTAALGVVQTAEVLDLVRRLRDEGHGVVLISHNLADVFAVADRICVLRLGTHRGTFRVGETSPEEVVGVMTGATPGTGSSTDG